MRSPKYTVSKRTFHTPDSISNRCWLKNLARCNATSKRLWKWIMMTNGKFDLKPKLSSSQIVRKRNSFVMLCWTKLPFFVVTDYWWTKSLVYYYQEVHCIQGKLLNTLTLISNQSALPAHSWIECWTSNHICPSTHLLFIGKAWVEN